MVYDISRNFIGDTHWRDGGVIEDGDELELDKGVLIQVGEKTESVEQDLRGLFEKKGKGRRNQGESGSGEADDDDDNGVSLVLPDPAPPGQTGMSAPSQLRPKTLNAILGAPSGSLGRATLPVKSPCELRRQKGHDTGVQREAKRRRIDERLSTTISQSSKLSSSITTQNPTNTAMPLPRTSTTAATRERNLGSRMGKAAANGRDSGRRSLSSSAHTKKRVQVATMTTEGMPTKMPQTSINHISTDNMTDETARPIILCSESTTLPPANAKASERLPGRIHSTGVVSQEPRNLQKPHDAQAPRQLQITSRKPARKKLIYQDLLLPSIAPRDSLFLSQEPGRENVSVNSSRKRGSEKRDIQAEFHRAQKERLESRLRRHRRREEKNSSSRQDGVEGLTTISDDDEEEDISSASYRDGPKTRQSTQEKPVDILPVEVDVPEENDVHTKTFLQRRSRETSPLLATSTSDLDLAQMDQILLATRSPSKPNNINPSSSSSFPPHCPISNLPPHDKEPQKHFQTLPPAPPPLILPTPPTHLHEPPSSLIHNKPFSSLSLPHPSKTKPRKRSPMRKTVSEPLATRGLAANPVAPPAPPALPSPVAGEENQGPDPWSREAWDLFGFGRPGGGGRGRGGDRGKKGEGEGKVVSQIR